MLAVWAFWYNDIIATENNDEKKKLIFSLCRYAYVVIILPISQTKPRIGRVLSWLSAGISDALTRFVDIFSLFSLKRQKTNNIIILRQVSPAPFLALAYVVSVVMSIHIHITDITRLCRYVASEN